MEKLMKPAEYAKELGISRQAVYAKIKRGILTAKSVDGKLYIVVDTEELPSPLSETSTPKKSMQKEKTSKEKEYKALLLAKDETIAVLKGTVKDLKKSNKQISTTLRSEIDLLKEAFHEMRALYVHQLSHKNEKELIDVVSHETEVEESVVLSTPSWIGVKKFLKQQKIVKPKQQEKVLKRLKKAYKAGDERLMKKEGKLKLNRDENYEDIVG
jgi:predicted DNA-binding protein YlxM (UPF0122 family)